MHSGLLGCEMVVSEEHVRRGSSGDAEGVRAFQDGMDVCWFQPCGPGRTELPQDLPHLPVALSEISAPLGHWPSLWYDVCTSGERQCLFYSGNSSCRDSVGFQRSCKTKTESFVFLWMWLCSGIETCRFWLYLGKLFHHFVSSFVI